MCRATALNTAEFIKRLSLPVSDVSGCGTSSNRTTAAEAGGTTADTRVKQTEEADIASDEGFCRLLILPTLHDFILLFFLQACKHVKATRGNRFLGKREEFSVRCEGQTRPIQFIFPDKN